MLFTKKLASAGEAVAKVKQRFELTKWVILNS
jgi:hypothetical protein